MRRRSEYKQHTGFRGFLVVLVLALVLLLSAFFIYEYVLRNYNITTVVVEGNIHYTAEEIKALVMDGKYGDNSIYLSHKYKNKEIKDVPFVETINVNVIDKNSVRITVYEKTLAGFIEYLGRYIYFDKDGIVVESSNLKTQGIPEVVGIDFDYVVLYEPLPAKDENLFKKVLNVTLLMTKYGVDAQKMYFASDGQIVLYKDQITINLGKEDNLDIKIMNLPSILDNLEGMNGTLRMENYDEGTKRVSFETN